MVQQRWNSKTRANRWDQELRSSYRMLIDLRRPSPALIDGGFQILLCEENILAYLRDTDVQQIIVIGNRGPGDRPAYPLFVRDGGIPDQTIFLKFSAGKPLAFRMDNYPCLFSRPVFKYGNPFSGKTATLIPLRIRR